jgi:Fe2+ or Zn2+ uptake regulation protein
MVSRSKTGAVDSRSRGLSTIYKGVKVLETTTLIRRLERSGERMELFTATKAPMLIRLLESANMLDVLDQYEESLVIKPPVKKPRRVKYRGLGLI